MQVLVFVLQPHRVVKEKIRILNKSFCYSENCMKTKRTTIGVRNYQTKRKVENVTRKLYTYMDIVRVFEVFETT